MSRHALLPQYAPTFDFLLKTLHQYRKTYDYSLSMEEYICAYILLHNNAYNESYEWQSVNISSLLELMQRFTDIDFLHIQDMLSRFIEIGVLCVSPDYSSQNTLLIYTIPDTVYKILDPHGYAEKRSFDEFFDTSAPLEIPKEEPPKVIDGWVYCVYNPKSGLTKIGKAKDVNARVHSLGMAIGTVPQMICAIQCSTYSQFEAKLLKHYSDCRVEGEWFNMSTKQQSSIKETLLSLLDKYNALIGEIKEAVYEESIN